MDEWMNKQLNPILDPKVLICVGEKKSVLYMRDFEFKFNCKWLLIELYKNIILIDSFRTI